jgi:hypothetical protein
MQPKGCGLILVARSTSSKINVSHNTRRRLTSTLFSDASLAVSLVECGDKGRVAVLQAESELMFVKMASSRAQAKVMPFEYATRPILTHVIVGRRDRGASRAPRS